MIRVRIELLSANETLVKELARVDIVNDETGNEDVGNYDVTAHEGPIRLRGRVQQWARKYYNTLALVREALNCLE
jgi:hypothetical protein